MRFYEIDGFLSVSRITGPRHNLLQLKLSTHGPSTPTCERLTAIGPNNHSALDHGKIIFAVIEGIAQANLELSSNYVVTDIRYVSNDSPPEAVYSSLAHAIVKHVVSGGRLLGHLTIHSSGRLRRRLIQALGGRQTMTRPLEAALSRTTETTDVDFKSSFDPGATRDWLELIKDIVSFANSGGGYILVGLDDDGLPSGQSVDALLAVDHADLGNKLHKYTGQHFSGVELIACEKNGAQVCAVRVAAAGIPIVFARVGEIELPDGKKKTVFAIGTVYFRHGAKSEPGTSEDLRAFLEREVESTRRSWLDGIAKVVEAPAGSRFAVLPPEGTRTGPSGALPMTLTTDPSAPAYYAVPLDTTHPFRQKEVVREVNTRLAGRKTINNRDIACIRRVFEIQKDIVRCYTQNFVSPRYSQQFVDWIIEQFDGNGSFFEETRAKYEQLIRGPAA